MDGTQNRDSQGIVFQLADKWISLVRPGVTRVPPVVKVSASTKEHGRLRRHRCPFANLWQKYG